jgi:alpha-ketoglutarate-dependent taurine dioxygenase
MKMDDQAIGEISFTSSRRKTVTISPWDLVKVDDSDCVRRFPLVIRAGNAETDLIGWIKVNLAFVFSELLRSGAILFRGFPLTDTDQFRQFLSAVSGEPVPYRERTSPRTRVVENVYTSTDYPHDQRILPHNENSYAITFPRRLFFWCRTAALQGGQTPLYDTRRVLACIDRSVIDEFIDRRWMYVRNFTPHFGLSWQTAFQTNDRSQVEAYCQSARIEWEWSTAGLRTRQIRPAVIRHHETGELAWFNHATFFHILNVEPNLRERLLAQYDERDLPNNTYYGDGSPIEDRVVKHLLEAYENEKASFLWEPGDIILIDNILTAHAREPFAGPRRILVAMTDPYTRTDL